MKTDLKFGDRIKIKGYIIRHKDGNKRYWTKHDYPEVKDGIFIKYITLADGNCEWEQYGYQGEDGTTYEFNADKYIPGAWIALENRKPEKVFLSDCEKIQ